MENQIQEPELGKKVPDPSAWITPIDVTAFFDDQTKNAIESGLFNQIIQTNQALIEMSDELVVARENKFKWPIVINQHIENDLPFTMAIPLSISGKYKSRTFSFGAYDPKSLEFVVFFNGDSKTQDRQEAIDIFKIVRQFCLSHMKHFVPFAIKLS